MSMQRKFLDTLPELRQRVTEADEGTKAYFSRGAELVLKDSGIDPQVMLGVVLWAYLDLLKQLDTQVMLEQAVLAFTDDEEPPPPKGELN